MYFCSFERIVAIFVFFRDICLMNHTLSLFHVTFLVFSMGDYTAVVKFPIF